MALLFYIIDTETTGLKAGYHEIIQISAVRFSDKMQKTINVRAEYPERASEQALMVTGKKISDLKEGIHKIEAVEEMNKFFTEDGKSPEHRCIVAHNASFDRRQMHAMWQSLSQTFPANLWLCTKEFTRLFAKKQGIVKPKLSLAASLEMTGISPKYGAHNAAIDVINTVKLFEKLLNDKLDYAKLVKRIPHE